MTEMTLTGGTRGGRVGGSPMRGEAAFWDEIAAKYAAQPIKNERAYAETLDRTRAHLSAEARVLEVGCGTGSTAVRLAPEVAHITATDISEAMLEIGRGRAREAGVENVDFEQVGLPDTPLAAAAYDAVLAFNALHLVRDLEAVLASLHTALQPGGLLISKTVCLAEQTRLWAVPLTVLRLLGKAPYVRLLTFADVERAMVDAGFEIVETGLYPAPHSRFVVARKRSPTKPPRREDSGCSV